MMKLSIPLLAIAVFVAQDQAPAAPFDPVAWNALHPELRWLAYRDAVTPETRAAWLRALAEHRDFETLELIAIYDYDARRGAAQPSPLSSLLEPDAPQWLRVAAWFVRGAHRRDAKITEGKLDTLMTGPADSHTQDEAIQAILDHRAVFLAWCARFPGESRHLSWLVDKLGDVDPDVEGARHLLPPLDPASALLAWLDAPPELRSLGRDDVPDPTVRYVHQVTRAIDGLVASGIIEPLYVRKLERLLEHEEPVVRRAAYLAFTHFPPAAIPWTTLAAQLSGSNAGLAALALTYSDHPGATLAVLDAFEHSDAVAEVCIDRFVENATWIERARVQQLSVDRPELTTAVRRIDARLRKIKPRQSVTRLPRQLEVVVWAQRTGHRLADSLRDAVLVEWSPYVDPRAGELRIAAATAAETYRPRAGLVPPEATEAFRDAVVALANELVAAIRER